MNYKNKCVKKMGKNKKYINNALDIVQRECSVGFEDIHTCSISYEVPTKKILYINDDVYESINNLSIDILTDIDVWFVNGKEYNPDKIYHLEIK